MNVLYVGLARTIWLFDLKVFNPTGMNLRGVLQAIGQRYEFAKTPKDETDFDDQHSLAFKSGKFVGKRKVPLALGFNIYNDGFVADTVSNTDESTEFLTELSRWLYETYGLHVPPNHRTMYLSQIDFESDTSMLNVNRRLEAFAGNLQALARDNKPYELGSIQFWTEEAGKPGVPGPVKIERKIFAPFSANHYFSQAPFQTKNHIEILNEFESILSQR